MITPELAPFLQAEYTALKSEQSTRIFVRENALYSVLLVIAGIVTISLTEPGTRLLILLALPPAVGCLTAIYINQDIMISRIRQYIEDELTPRLAQVASRGAPAEQGEAPGAALFAWERLHRSLGASRVIRKLVSTGLLVIVLGGSSAMSLFAARSTTFQQGGWIIFLWWFDAILTLGVIAALLSTIEL